MKSWLFWRRVAVAGVLATSGCRLVDQTSFGHAPHAPAPDALTAALASPGTSPLLVIRPDDGVPYQDLLRAAVEAAEARDGAVRFRLEAVAPPGNSLDDQQAALGQAATAARAVLDDLGADGVPPDRVALTARSDPRIDHAEIRLYQG